MVHYHAHGGRKHQREVLRQQGFTGSAVIGAANRRPGATLPFDPRFQRSAFDPGGRPARVMPLGPLLRPDEMTNPSMPPAKTFEEAHYREGLTDLPNPLFHPTPGDASEALAASIRADEAQRKRVSERKMRGWDDGSGGADGEGTAGFAGRYTKRLLERGRSKFQGYDKWRDEPQIGRDRPDPPKTTPTVDDLMPAGILKEIQALQAKAAKRIEQNARSQPLQAGFTMAKDQKTGIRTMVGPRVVEVAKPPHSAVSFTRSADSPASLTYSESIASGEGAPPSSTRSQRTNVGLAGDTEFPGGDKATLSVPAALGNLRRKIMRGEMAPQIAACRGGRGEGRALRRPLQR